MKIEFDNSTGVITEGSYLRIAGGSWWKTQLLVTDANANTLTVQWSWWAELWFQYPIIGFIWGAAIQLLWRLGQ